LKSRYVLITIVLCAGLFWMSSDPSPPQPPKFFEGQDKVIHAVLYAVLAAVVSLGIRRSGGTPRFSEQFAAPILFAALYGLSDEIHQLFVPHRNFDPWDVAADALGAAAIQVVLCFFLWAAHHERGSTAQE